MSNFAFDNRDAEKDSKQQKSETPTAKPAKNAQQVDSAAASTGNNLNEAGPAVDRMPYLRKQMAQIMKESVHDVVGYLSGEIARSAKVSPISGPMLTEFREKILAKEGIGDTDSPISERLRILAYSLKGGGEAKAAEITERIINFRKSFTDLLEGNPNLQFFGGPELDSMISRGALLQKELAAAGWYIPEIVLLNYSSKSDSQELVSPILGRIQAAVGSQEFEGYLVADDNLTTGFTTSAGLVLFEQSSMPEQNDMQKPNKDYIRIVGDEFTHAFLLSKSVNLNAEFKPPVVVDDFSLENDPQFGGELRQIDLDSATELHGMLSHSVCAAIDPDQMRTLVSHALYAKFSGRITEEYQKAAELALRILESMERTDKGAAPVSAWFADIKNTLKPLEDRLAETKAEEAKIIEEGRKSKIAVEEAFEKLEANREKERRIIGELSQLLDTKVADYSVKLSDAQCHSMSSLFSRCVNKYCAALAKESVEPGP